MKIIQYEYRDAEGWEYAKAEFGKLNLLVGDTATGKSRYLNTIFNLGRFVAAKEFKNGAWDMVFEHDCNQYKWQLETEKREDERKPGVVVKDNLWKFHDQRELPIVARDAERFTFEGTLIPKLSPQETSISLLREEATLRVPFEGFSSIQRRLFSQDALQTAIRLETIPRGLVDSIERKKDLRTLFSAEMSLSANLSLLSTYFKDEYKQIVEHYRTVFPFIQEVRISSLADLQPNVRVSGHLPVITIRERNTAEWIPITQLSSGMLKVLLMLTDMFIIPVGSVYMIDEYENSLGMNAIDFFPQFILEFDKEIQFFITSHHPYIINEIPPSNWYIFHRNGKHVTVKYGAAIAERFSKSRQKAFIQLINDPYFSRGVE